MIKLTNKQLSGLNDKRLLALFKAEKARLRKAIANDSSYVINKRKIYCSKIKSLLDLRKHVEKK